jgi:outer membrane biosynthesis protein TonB
LAAAGGRHLELVLLPIRDTERRLRMGVRLLAPLSRGDLMTKALIALIASAFVLGTAACSKQEAAGTRTTDDATTTAPDSTTMEPGAPADPATPPPPASPDSTTTEPGTTPEAPTDETTPPSDTTTPPPQ